MRVIVRPGAIIINSLWQSGSGKAFKAFEADLGSKYPGPLSFSWSVNQIGVSISVNEHTLNTDPDHGNAPTEIIFQFIGAGGWIIVGNAVRYSLYVAMWKPATDPTKSMVYDRENKTGAEAE